eukprot:3300241-Pleurochrysis_carterae.AAC.1
MAAMDAAFEGLFSFADADDAAASFRAAASAQAQASERTRHASERTRHARERRLLFHLCPLRLSCASLSRLVAISL